MMSQKAKFWLFPLHLPAGDGEREISRDPQGSVKEQAWVEIMYFSWTSENSYGS